MTLRATLLAALGLLALPVQAQSIHNTGTVTFQVFGDGRLGANQGVGTGFTFTGVNGLYEAALMVGNSEDRISGQAYAGATNTPANDWVQSAAPAPLTPPFPAPYDAFDQGFEATFTDAAAPNPFGISVRQRTYSSSAAPNNDFVIVEYQITNTTTTDYSDMYVGMFADWDVNAATANFSEYDAATQSLNVFDTAAATLYYGMSVISQPISGYELEIGDGSNPVDGQVFIGMTTDGDGVVAPDDIRSLVGQFGGDLTAGGTILARFAMLGGATQADFLANAQVALDLFPVMVAGEADPRTVTDALSLPAPNPASGVARVTLSLDAAEAVRVTVSDVLGRTVATLHDGGLAAGATPLSVEAGALAPGVYVIRAVGETFRQTRTLTVVR